MDTRLNLTDDELAAVEVLWAYDTMGHTLGRCDVAIVLGCHDLGVADVAASIYHAGLAPILVCSGATNQTWAKRFPRGEAAHFSERAIELGVPTEAVISEPNATNTGENIVFSRRALAATGVFPSSVLLVSMPYMQRRAYATSRRQWPEMKAVCASEQVEFSSYARAIGDVRLVVECLVGDTQRVFEYPRLGFAIEQPATAQVHDAFRHLCALGYDGRLWR